MEFDFEVTSSCDDCGFTMCEEVALIKTKYGEIALCFPCLREAFIEFAKWRSKNRSKQQELFKEMEDA